LVGELGMIRTLPDCDRLSDLLNELKARLVELYGQRLFALILFGSQARGEATPDSDIGTYFDIGGQLYRCTTPKR